MSAIAIVCMVGAFIIIWGGLVASSIFLIKRPELESYPAGGDDVAGERLE